MKDINIEASWKAILEDQFMEPYFIKMVDFIKSERSKGKTIFPSGSQIFNAFNSCPFESTRVVILGQDPYHGEGEAMGLCFSVPKGKKVPPSLVNIFKELKRDLNMSIPPHGDLSAWCNQGVLLLNASLTVEKDLANSHKNIGWQLFTDTVIKKLSDQKKGLVFMLWGNFARSKKILIDDRNHLILECSHPSPLAGAGFYGSCHFSKANAYLNQAGHKPIDWNILNS